MLSFRFIDFQNKTVAGYAHYDTGEEVGGTLSIRYLFSSIPPVRINLISASASGAGSGEFWTNSFGQQDNFTSTPKFFPGRWNARRNPLVFRPYFTGRSAYMSPKSGALITAVFPQGDFAHDWMLAYLVSEHWPWSSHL